MELDDLENPAGNLVIPLVYNINQFHIPLGAAAAIPVQYVDPFNGINPAPNDPILNERSDEWIHTNFAAVSFRTLFDTVKASKYKVVVSDNL